jgi:hypothetical protein
MPSATPLGRAARQGAGDQPDRPGLGELVVAAEIGDHADMYGLAQLVGAQHAQDAVLDVGRLVDLGVAHQLHAEAEALQMLLQAKDEQLPLGRTPIGPETLEHAAAILHHPGKGMDPGVLIANDLAIEAHELGGRHARAPWLLLAGFCNRVRPPARAAEERRGSWNRAAHHHVCAL